MIATTDKPNVADLLGAATKKKGTTNHLTFSEPGVLALAERWLSMSAQQDEAEREKKLLADQILASVSRWHRETCQKRHSFDGTVVLPAASGAVRISFQNRYGKIPLDRENELRAALHGDYDRLVKRNVGIKVKKEVAEDPDKLEKLVLTLAEALGDQFAETFEVEQFLSPTDLFTQTSYQFSDETRTALEAAGVKQVTAFVKGKA